MKPQFVFFSLIFFLVLLYEASSQGVAINESSSSPDPNAILDISSSTKGVLIPRLTTPERISLGITTPAEGLLVYDADSSSFYFFDGGWKRLSAGNIITNDNSVILTQPLMLGPDAVVYNEFRVPTSAAKTGGVGTPQFNQVTTLGNIYQYFFQDISQQGNEQSLYFNIEMPHTWKEGSAVFPHIHWMPSTTGTGTVRWGLEYTWVNMDGTFGPTTTIYGSQAVSNQYKHLTVPLNSAAMDATGKESSSILLCRVFRNSSHPSDTYTGSAILIAFDIHYQIDRLGDAVVIP